MRNSGVSAILGGGEYELPLHGSIFCFVHYHERMKELGWLCS